jgi:hypothetical protein
MAAGGLRWPALRTSGIGFSSQPLGVDAEGAGPRGAELNGALVQNLKRSRRSLPASGRRAEMLARCPPSLLAEAVEPSKI